VETELEFVKARSHSEIEYPDRSAVIFRHDSLKSAKNVIFPYWNSFYCSIHNPSKSMESVILFKQTLLYPMVETEVKFVKAPSHSEIETPDRSVVTSIACNGQKTSFFHIGIHFTVRYTTHPSRWKASFLLSKLSSIQWWKPKLNSLKRLHTVRSRLQTGRSSRSLEIGKNRHFYILQFILLFDTQFAQVDGKRHSC